MSKKVFRIYLIVFALTFIIGGGLIYYYIYDDNISYEAMGTLVYNEESVSPDYYG